MHFIHPLKPETHAENILVNIYSGEEAISDVTFIEVGTKELIRFQKSLPDGFNSRLKIQIVTMATTKMKSQHTEVLELQH